MLDAEAAAATPLGSVPTATFVAGSDTAIPWLERGIVGCRRGDVLHASDAEGRVVYTIFVRFVAAASEKSSSSTDRIARAEEHRQAGNTLLKNPQVKRTELRDAILAYNRALNMLAPLPDFVSRAAPLRLNIALAYLRLAEWAPALRQCDLVLQSDRDNTKALFRRGHAHLELGAYQVAITDLRAAKRLSPDDAVIANMLEQAVNKLYRVVQMDRQLFAQTYNKMVNGPVFDKQSTSI